MGGIYLNEAVCYGFVILSGAILLNSATDITMLQYPEAKRKLMVGKHLELVWTFDVQKTTKQSSWSVSLFIYNFTKHSKDKLIKLDDNGDLTKNPTINPAIFQRLYCSLVYNISTKGFARFHLPSTNFDDSAAYGLSFQATNDKPVVKATEVKIVDMLLNKEESSPRIIKTWIGQTITLVCSVILKTGIGDSPTFKWKNEVKNITITKNIIREWNRSTLQLIPVDEDDFGSYMCRARTHNTKVKYNITIIKIEKPGRPISLDFLPRAGSLSWQAPRYDEYGSVSTFVVQMLQDETTCTWVDVNTTSQLSLPLNSLSTVLTGSNFPELCSVRVCKRDSENKACSEVLRSEPMTSPAPNVGLVKYFSGRASLSWERQPGDNAPIFGYIIQVIKKSSKWRNDVLKTIHVNDQEDKGKHTFRKTEKIKDALLRVCIRNSLCIYETSCSDKVTFYPVYPSAPRNIRVLSSDNSSEIEVTWKRPRIEGQGSIHYIVEVKKAGSVHWRSLVFTKNLHARFKVSKIGDRVRVCAHNDVGRATPSCSKGIDLKKKVEAGEVAAGSASYSASEIIAIVTILVSLHIG